MYPVVEMPHFRTNGHDLVIACNLHILTYSIHIRLLKVFTFKRSKTTFEHVQAYTK
jgi:hypothetical protein